MGAFEVLVVCSGNLCRSPVAAALLRAGLGPGSAVRVASAGTRAMVGSAPPPRLVRLAARRGLDLRDVVPRQLTCEHLEAADLVLTATRAHRATVVGAHPGVLRRTFTLRELARLLAVPADGPAGPVPEVRPLARRADRAPADLVPADLVPAVAGAAGGAGALATVAPRVPDDLAESLRAEDEALRWASLAPSAAVRRAVSPARAQDDDVVDPYRRSRRTHRAALDQVEVAVSTLLAAVGR